MKKDNFFKFSFFFTILVMLFVFSSNIQRATLRESKRPLSEEKERIVLERIDLEKIKKLQEEDKLSNREALFYETIK